MKKHYLDLKDMPFYAGLCKYMSSGPILAMVTHTHTHTLTHTYTHSHPVRLWHSCLHIFPFFISFHFITSLSLSLCVCVYARSPSSPCSLSLHTLFVFKVSLSVSFYGVEHREVGTITGANMIKQLQVIRDSS